MNYDEQQNYESRLALCHNVKLNLDKEQIKEWERFVKAFDASPKRSPKYKAHLAGSL